MPGVMLASMCSNATKLERTSNMFKVFIIESEAGWGQKVDEVKRFDTKQEALKFVEDYNAKYNPPGPTPSWYMIAQYGGEE